MEQARGVGDFDDDGFDDLLIIYDAERAPELGEPTGVDTAVLVYGRATDGGRFTLPRAGFRSAVFRVSLDRPWVRLREARALGDIDGFDDVALAIPGNDGNYSMRPGRVMVLWGASELPSVVTRGSISDFATSIEPTEGDPSFATVSSAGDLNLDGVPDLLLGAYEKPRDDVHGVGEAYVLFGRRDLAEQETVELEQEETFIRLIGEDVHHNLGDVMSPAGDFNGDGLPDLCVLSPFPGFVAREPDVGRAYVIFGYGDGRPPFSLVSNAPELGPLRGGTEVVIRGTGFDADPEVRFDGRPAISSIRVSEMEIVAVSPSRGESGIVDISVTIGGLTKHLRSAFSYAEAKPSFDFGPPSRDKMLIEGAADSRLGKVMAVGEVDGDGDAEILVGWEDRASWTLGILLGGGPCPRASIHTAIEIAFESSGASVHRCRVDLFPHSLGAVSAIREHSFVSHEEEVFDVESCSGASLLPLSLARSLRLVESLGPREEGRSPSRRHQRRRTEDASSGTVGHLAARRRAGAGLRAPATRGILATRRDSARQEGTRASLRSSRQEARRSHIRKLHVTALSSPGRAPGGTVRQVP